MKMNDILNMAKNAKGGADLLQTAANEFLAIHDLLDRLEVPRLHNGELASASQRVATLVGAYKTACASVGRVGL